MPDTKSITSATFSAIGFILVIGFLPITEHRAHAISLLPLLVLLAFEVEKEFPAAYEEWARATPRLIPAMGRHAT